MEFKKFMNKNKNKKTKNNVTKRIVMSEDYVPKEYLKEYSKGFQTKKEKEIEKKNSYKL